jgi:putative hydrolase of the HAD superfamily
MRFRAIFFDAGETIVHPAPTFPELFASVLEGAGHPRDARDVLGASSVVLDRFREASATGDLWTTSPGRSRAFWMDVYTRMLTALDLPSGDGLRAELYRAFTDLANYALFDDVRPVLRVLGGSGTTLGIVSNFEVWLEELLGVLGVRDAFGVRVISGEVGMEKPDPRIYALALERAGVRAQDAAFVGDNPVFDVHPPAALGMFPVLIDRRGRHSAFDGPGVRITDMAALPAALEAA